MKKLFALFLVVVSVLCLFGCNKTKPPLTDKLKNEEDNYSNMGTEEVFASKEVWPNTNLQLKISNVKEVKAETGTDSVETWEVKTYVVYPNAKITVENADMILHIDDGKKYPQWAILTNSENTERIDIVDDMQPIQITKDMLNLFTIEGYIVCARFEIVEP